MTALEELALEFGDVIASEIVDSLFHSGLEIRSGIKALPRGFTGARLAKAQLANITKPYEPRWCVIKFCPPESTHHRRESEIHADLLRQPPVEFSRRHLTDIAFPPVRCPQGALVIGQSKADGIPLGRVELHHLAGACGTIWSEMLFKWSGHNYDSERSTLAELLKCELGESFEDQGWLRDWARRRGLLAPTFLDLPDEETPLPNPWRLFDVNMPAAQTDIDYLVGRTHGDLHGDNVLVPVHGGIVEPDGFRLIDLATYDEKAPLSRDVATLLISLCSREIGESSADSRCTFLAYLERDKRDDQLDDGMTGKVRKVIDALREPALRFVDEKGWDPDLWNRQLKVSLLAQAMLHSAYKSGPAHARRWCSRLAGWLTRSLLGHVDLPPATAMPFDAGELSQATGTVAPWTNGRPARSGSVFVDRTGQRSHLRAALDDQVTSVIVVSGPAGMGKTALVREVLAELGWADPDDETSAVRWHDATPYEELGVPVLIEDIEPPGSGQVAGPSARARLEIALDSLDPGGTRPVIVIDSAENLLKDDHILRDSELDLALEAVQRRSLPCVKVVFVTQHVPEATSGVGWAETAAQIHLEGLEPPSFREYFAMLDPSGRHGLANLPEVDLRRIHGRLAGSPRFAELLHAILSGDPPGLLVHEIGAWLSSVRPSEVHQRLVQRFVDQLPSEQQRVAEGLAALGVPVGTEAVIGVLETYVPAALVESALRSLVAARLVLELRDGRRYLRKTEIEAVLSRLGGGDRWADEGEPPTRLDLLLQAARVLQSMQKDEGDVRGLADMDMRFARADVWLRAGMHEQAYGVIESMTELVDLWGSGGELRAQREAVRGRLRDDREGEMLNLAALGDIYSYGGDLSSARSTYEDALNIAKERHDREAIRRIHIGMGMMFWEHDHLGEAEERYGWAFGLAGEDDDDGGGDRAAALVGLADCQQRHGNYRRAIADALSAFEAARDSDPALASAAALRLTRWYAELNEIRNAQMMLDRCSDLITARPNPSTRADLLNSKADLALHLGKHTEARSAAGQAIRIARGHRDPINLRRSLAIQALTHVHLDDFLMAREAIEESARYRVAGRETVELALRAIIAHRSGFPGTAKDLFRQLHDETSNRTKADRNDLAAWDFTGIARCYSVLLDDATPAKALEAFRRARPEPVERTPGLNDRLRFMVETLANGDARLEPVLVTLARIRPGPAG
ncbi:AAA family ATPase [Streptomyces sp. NPDC093510]|uniref:AAA family ATPase n=1 Tax=Streptomyces sp. NPDC093510 TaxID=3155199 RepID=UPI003432610C